MKPVLIQHLVKQRKRFDSSPMTKKEEEQKTNDRAASFLLWALGIIVVLSLIAL